MQTTATLREKYTNDMLKFYGDLYTREYLEGLNEKNFALLYAKYEDAKAMALWDML